jgi:hypothetical protein
MLLLAFAAFFFIGISAILARALSATGTEREKALDVARAEARGDAQAVLRMTPACNRDQACRAATLAFAGTLKRPGDVQVGTGRLAWRAGDGLPVVQCIRVQRGNPLSGGDVTLLAVSRPIKTTAPCP